MRALPGSQYSNDERREAAANYVVMGNLSRVSRAVNIPRRTLFDWANSDWWQDLVQQIRHEKKDELDAEMSNAIHRAVQRTTERLESGDAYIAKDGEVAYKPVSGRDAATITGILFDKRQLLRNQATSIKTESTDARLADLASKVRELQGGTTTIEGEVVEKG